MFPFSTREFSYSINVTVQEFEDRLNQYSEKFNFIIFSRTNTRGKITGYGMNLELSEMPLRNSFRPSIVFKWHGDDKKTVVTGYYKISNASIIFSGAFPLIGIIYAFKTNSIYPVIFWAIPLLMVYYVLAYLFFIKEYDWVKTNFEDILNGTLPKQRFIR